MLTKKNRFTFNTSVAEQDFPKLQAVVNYGSPELRWDVSGSDIILLIGNIGSLSRDVS